MTYQFKVEDFKNVNFTDREDCALARLIKRNFPGSEVLAGCNWVYINGENHNVSNPILNGEKLSFISCPGLDAFAFNTLEDAFAINPDTVATIDITPGIIE